MSDAETVKLLREYGVDYVQGFHIGADATEITSIAVDPPSRSSAANLASRGGRPFPPPAGGERRPRLYP